MDKCIYFIILGHYLQHICHIFQAVPSPFLPPTRLFQLLHAFVSSLSYRNLLITKLVVEPCLLRGAAVVVDNSVQSYHHIRGFLYLSVFLPPFILTFAMYAMLKLEELS